MFDGKTYKFAKFSGLEKSLEDIEMVLYSKLREDRTDFALANY